MAGAKVNGYGALFKNTRKERDNHPDYTGNFKMSKDLLKSFIETFRKDPNLVELEVELAAWKKTGPRSGDYLSVAVSPPFEKKAAPAKDDLSDPPF